MKWLEYWRQAYAEDRISLEEFEARTYDSLLYGYSEMPKGMVYDDGSWREFLPSVESEKSCKSAVYGDGGN